MTKINAIPLIAKGVGESFLFTFLRKKSKCLLPGMRAGKPVRKSKYILNKSRNLNYKVKNQKQAHGIFLEYFLPNPKKKL